MRVPTLQHLAEVMKLNFSNSPGENAVEAVELRVHMDCPGCERTVRKALSRLSGIHNVEIDREQQKVTVMGFVDKDKVLNRVRRKGKLAELWPTEAELSPVLDPGHQPDSLLEFGLVDYPYSYNRPLHYSYVNGGGLPAHDLPSVYTSAAVRAHGPFVDAFNDDNPNNCSIM
ncbi:hypothetical protein GOP47_0014542 [Adiantum capillus-veneris]|uniref:HMA domain-containing protein n=1 Tax=Adiantum capillus-veneris TaxID=13818 RepID=A0A9D4UM84_ADICA|nr:hypothetical protein GOP47_0014542 [Adiantum capillus-veneris]